MSFLQSKNLKLYKFSVRFITPAYIEWLNDPEVNQYLYVGRAPVTESEVSAPKDNDVIKFAIMAVESGGDKYIGTCSINRINSIDKSCELGYMIGNKRYWGKGLATEMIGMLSGYCFNRLNMNKVEAGVVDGNIGSMRALEKNGFVKYCEIPEHFFLQKKYLSMHRYYKLQRWL